MSPVTALSRLGPRPPPALKDSYSAKRVTFAQPPVWWRLVDKEPKMSRTVVAVVLCLLLSINLAALALNLSRPSQAGTLA